MSGLTADAVIGQAALLAPILAWRNTLGQMVATETVNPLAHSIRSLLVRVRAHCLSRGLVPRPPSRLLRGHGHRASQDRWSLQALDEVRRRPGLQRLTAPSEHRTPLPGGEVLEPAQVADAQDIVKV